MDAGVVRCTFEITFEEFLEAALAMQQVNARREQAAAQKGKTGIVAVVLSLTVIIVLTAVLSWLWGDPFADIRPPHYILFTMLLPTLMISAAVMALNWAQRVVLPETRGSLLRRLWPAAVRLAGFVFLVGLLLAAWLPRASERDESTGRPAYDWYGAFLPHVSWVLFAAIVYLFARRAARDAIRQLWEQQPSLTRQRTIDIGPDGFMCDEKVVLRRYEWVALARFVETERLMLACPSDISFEIIPKRAFTSPADLEAARALLQTQIRDRESGPTGFAVLTPGGARVV